MRPYTPFSLLYICKKFYQFGLLSLKVNVDLLYFSGICADIAASKHEYWSSFAPLPFELVMSAGQKAKEECLEKGKDDLFMGFLFDFVDYLGMDLSHGKYFEWA